ncbi:MAG: hypothetical protein KDE31_28450, partial [Caldilineaceae bacterium]|nr:hypothetical protein [Caldilineaceae bacterium]
QQPTLLLASAKDRLFPPRIARAACTYIPQVQFHVVPQTGHAAFLENPLDFTNVVLAYLDGKPTAAPPVIARSKGADNLRIDTKYHVV